MKRVAAVFTGIIIGVFFASSSWVSPSAEASVTELVSPGDKLNMYIYGGDMKVTVIEVVDECWIRAKARGGYTHFNMCNTIAFKREGK